MGRGREGSGWAGEEKGVFEYGKRRKWQGTGRGESGVRGSETRYEEAKLKVEVAAG